LDRRRVPVVAPAPYDAWRREGRAAGFPAGMPQGGHIPSVRAD